MERSRYEELKQRLTNQLTNEEKELFFKKINVVELAGYFNGEWLSDHFKEFCDYFYELRSVYPCYVPLYNELEDTVYVDDGFYFYHAKKEKEELLSQMENKPEDPWDQHLLENKVKMFENVKDSDIVLIEKDDDNFGYIKHYDQNKVMAIITSAILNKIIKFEKLSLKFETEYKIDKIWTSIIKSVEDKGCNFSYPKGNDDKSFKYLNIYSACVKGEFSYKNKNGEIKECCRIRLPIQNRYITFSIPKKCVLDDYKHLKTIRLFVPCDIQFNLTELKDNNFEIIKSIKGDDLSLYFKDMEGKDKLI